MGAYLGSSRSFANRRFAGLNRQFVGRRISLIGTSACLVDAVAITAVAKVTLLRVGSGAVPSEP